MEGATDRVEGRRTGAGGGDGPGGDVSSDAAPVPVPVSAPSPDFAALRASPGTPATRVQARARAARASSISRTDMAANRLAVSESSTPADSSAGAAGRDRDRDAADDAADEFRGSGEVARGHHLKRHVRAAHANRARRGDVVQGRGCGA